MLDIANVRYIILISFGVNRDLTMKRKKILLPRRKNKYRFRDLKEIGDSFAVPLDGPLDLNRYRVAAVAAAKRIGGGVKFSIRQLPNGNYRCWRVG